MTPRRRRFALAAALAAAAGGVAATGCGEDSEEPASTVSEDSSEYGEPPGYPYDDVLATPNKEKEDYKEILDQVQEAAEETAP